MAVSGGKVHSSAPISGWVPSRAPPSIFCYRQIGITIQVVSVETPERVGVTQQVKVLIAVIYVLEVSVIWPCLVRRADCGAVVRDIGALVHCSDEALIDTIRRVEIEHRVVVGI